jgi:hypothetical protein
MALGMPSSVVGIETEAFAGTCFDYAVVPESVSSRLISVGKATL